MKRVNEDPSTKRSTVSPLLTGALELAESGLRVFPVHHAGAFGTCSCGRKDCKSIAKHPRITRSQSEATNNPGQIRTWWKKWPEANIGLAAGKGLIVVDIDSPEGERHAQELGLPQRTM
jgi:putative DNA primase/helicase